MTTTYDLNKIKFATDEATFKRAVALYESGKVTEVETLGGYYFFRCCFRDGVVSCLHEILQPFGLQDEPFEQKNTPRAQLNKELNIEIQKN